MHTLQDRVKIARAFQDDKVADPDYIVAIQTYLNCNEKSCSGGSVAEAWDWVRNFRGGGIPTEQCMRYEATDVGASSSCDDELVCKNCMGTATFSDDHPAYHCFAVPRDEPAIVPCFGAGMCRMEPYPRVGVEDFGGLPPMDEAAIRAEIGLRGPVTCAVDALSMLQYDGLSTMEDSPSLGFGDDGRAAHGRRVNDLNLTDHIVSVVGWGTDESGVDYWEFRNSWGDYWGAGGFGRVRRGRNDLLVESQCSWVRPTGWGTPELWQDYDAHAVDGAIAVLLESIALAEEEKERGTASTPGGEDVLLSGSGKASASWSGLVGCVLLSVAVAAACMALRQKQRGVVNASAPHSWAIVATKEDPRSVPSYQTCSAPNVAAFSSLSHDSAPATGDHTRTKTTKLPVGEKAARCLRPSPLWR